MYLVSANIWFYSFNAVRLPSYAKSSYYGTRIEARQQHVLVAVTLLPCDAVTMFYYTVLSHVGRQHDEEYLQLVPLTHAPPLADTTLLPAYSVSCVASARLQRQQNEHNA